MDNLEIHLPGNAENLQLPDPTLYTYYQNLEKRVIWLETEVDEYSLDLVKQIIKWNEEDRNMPIKDRIPIKVFFFSPGGDLDVNNALIDTISMSQTPVWGVNTGECYSAAAYIFLSCHRRFTFPRAQLLLHQGSGTFSGSYQEIVPQVVAYQEQIQKLALFVAERTDYTKEEVEENITSDWYISAQEGLNKKVYTDLVKDISVLL